MTEAQSNQPEQPDETEEFPVWDEVQFLQSAHNPLGVRPGLDKHLDDLQERTGASEREMLRVSTYLLSCIASSMPWNELDGLDAKRFDHRHGAALPSWRACIGAILGIDYSDLQPSEEEEEEEGDEESSE